VPKNAFLKKSYPEPKEVKEELITGLRGTRGSL
jgi:hypothetical protein